MKRKFTKYPSSYVTASYSEASLNSAPTKPRSNEFNLIASDGDWKCIAPLTHNAAKWFASIGGKKGKWAIAYDDDRYFNHYLDRGPIYIFVNTSRPSQKYCYSAATGYFYDINDRAVSDDVIEAFFSEHPKFSKIYE